MPNPIQQMMASILASQLQADLDAYDSADGSTTWLHAASRELSSNDFKSLVSECRKRLAKLKKEADGCPDRVFGWQAFFDEKFK